VLGENAFNKLISEYSANLHYDKLISLFIKTIKNFKLSKRAL
jgi:hypothetical protein